MTRTLQSIGSIGLRIGFGLILALGLLGGAPSQAAPQAPGQSGSGPLAAPATCGQAVVVSSPNGLPPQSGYPVYTNHLAAAVAITATDMWAVGDDYAAVNQENEAFYGGLTLHWNGSQWTAVRSIDADFEDNYHLRGVGATATNDVWAVGYNEDHNFVPSQTTLTLHWNGSAWTPVSAPNPDASGYNALAGVAPVTATNAWATGWSGSSTGHHTLMLHWNGTVWTPVAAPSPGTSANRFNAIAARTASDIWAVGSYGSAGLTQTLIAHWNGSAWAQVASPNPGSTNQLWGVAVRAADDAWAVGSSDSGTVALHWNGTAWSVVPGASAGTGAMLNSVAIRGAGDVWAAGSSASGTQMLLERWDGAHWTVVPQQAPAGNAVLSGVATTLTDVWAVGNTPASTRIMRQALVPFSDVPGTTFASYIEPLYCLGIVDGYGDNTFQPNARATRATLARWLVKARGWAINTTGGPHFSDVPASSPDYPYVETAYHHNVLSGYGDGTFRPTNPVTRGQMSKMIVNALGWAIDTTGGPHFQDVPAANPFYTQIETLYNHGAISGYTCGTSCLEFRWGNYLTRGQLSKVLDLAIVP